LFGIKTILREFFLDAMHPLPRDVSKFPQPQLLRETTQEEEPMKSAVPFVFAAALGLMSAPASAQFAKPEHAVKYRQSAMYVMNFHVNSIGAMVNGRVPYDPKAASDHADLVASVSRLPWKGFVPETDKLSKSVKPELWTEQPKFKETADKLMADTTKLAAAAKTSNLDELKAAFRATANTCKSCHDAYTNF
jgi:cytochrome c556